MLTNRNYINQEIEKMTKKQRLNDTFESKHDYLENKTSSLFWEIELYDADISIRAGKIGFDGEVTKLSLSSVDEAKTQYTKLLNEKQTESFTSVKKLTRAFDIYYSETNLNQGWAFGQPVGIKAEQWPRESSGSLMNHLFTVWVPHEYRVKGEEYVAVSVFQGDDTDLYSATDLHPMCFQVADHLETGYAWIWLTQDEFCGELTSLSELMDQNDQTALRFLEVIPRQYDPNVGKAPTESSDDFDDDDEAYDDDIAWMECTKQAGKDVHEEARKLFTDEDYEKLLKGPYIEIIDPKGSKVKLARFQGAWGHFGGTLNPDYMGGAPTLATPYFIEIEDDFGGANFGGGVCQIDLVEEKVKWSC